MEGTVKPQQAFAAAQEHQRRGDLARAESLYRQVLQAEPGHALAWYLLATCCQGQRRPQEAAACYRQAAQARPEFAEAYNDLGNVLRVLGDTAGAAASFREALRVRPDMVEPLNNLGNLALDQGRDDEALAHYQEAVRRRPDFADARYNLARALRRRGSQPEARAELEAAIRLRPGFAEAHNLLGAILADQGRLEEAEAELRTAIRLRPALAEAHYHLGNVVRDRGRPDEAERCFRETLRLRPRYAHAFNNLGNLLHAQDRLGEAEAALRQATRWNPQLAEAHNNLANVLHKQGRHDEAQACYRQAVGLKPDYADAYFNMGTALYDQAKFAESEAALCQAVRIKPDHATAQLNLAATLLEQGKAQEALDPCLAAMRLDPGAVRSYYHLGELAAEGYYRFTDEELDRIRAMLGRPGLSDPDASLLHFAAAHHLNKQGAYDEAFDHYRQANACRHRELVRTGDAFEPEKNRRRADRVIELFTPARFAELRDIGLAGERPLFVVGMPRSGTSLVEQVLASHPRVFGAGELTEIHQLSKKLVGRDTPPSRYPACIADLDHASARELAAAHLRRLEELGGGADRVVDKLPENYLYLGLISVLFPQARVIHCRRDALDTCVSCFFQNFTSMPYTWDLAELAKYYRDYERLMVHWRAVATVRVCEVWYEELVDDLEGIGRRLIAFAGLDWDPRCLAFYETKRVVQTASKLQVRKPVYRSSVGRWRRYARHLHPLTDALGLPPPEPEGPGG